MQDLEFWDNIVEQSIMLCAWQVCKWMRGLVVSIRLWFFKVKLCIGLGPLATPLERRLTHYAQLYVLDSDMESTQRFANMNVPASLSRNQRNVLKQFLEIVQRCLHDVNPFIHDFKQIMEIPGSDLANGKIVISAKVKDTLISCQHFYIFAYIDIYIPRSSRRTWKKIKFADKLKGSFYCQELSA